MSKSVVKTKIPIAQLAVGMLVTGMDRPWYATPFLSHRMTITKEAEIATLKACGVKMVEVEVTDTSVEAPPPASSPVADSVDRGAAVARQGAGHAAGSAAGEPKTCGPSGPAVEPDKVPFLDRRTSAPVRETEVAEIFRSSQGDGPPTPFEEELRAAQAGYEEARAAVQTAMAQAKTGRAFELEAVSRAVGRLADSILRNPHALASLSRLKSHDEYTYYHSVNTCVLGMALGHQWRMSREMLKKLGLGVLLHDVGKTQVPADLLNKVGRLEASETELLKQHVLRGVEYLTETLKLPEDILLPALEHHERMDGSGYPHGRKRPELSEFGLIAGVVDVYDALTSDRPYRKAVSPHQALQTLYDLSRRAQLDAACVERFIRCMGIYPVGSCVKLSTGEIGVVSKINPTQTLNPVVVIVRDSTSGVVGRPRLFDLALQSGNAVKRITEVVQPSMVGVVPNDVLNAVQFASPRQHAA